MSLIEREKLIEHLNVCLAESDGGTPITDAVIVAIRCAVEQMPEVDAVPVVRCGECVYGLGDGFVCTYGRGTCFSGRGTFPSSYCDSGERRAE